METTKQKRGPRLVIAVVAICLCLTLADGNLRNTAQTGTETPAGMLLAALPHRRLAWESPKRATALTEAVCRTAVNVPTAGFTLIELSIVLVIIGLISGGILVGMSLIKAAEVRAEITQIEKLKTAANTFYEKYMALPGDMNATAAGSFGFSPRGQYAGEGDGNGLIEGNYGNCLGCNSGHMFGAGETDTFWVDLSFAKMIEGSFALGSETVCAPALTLTSSPGLNDYFPAAKISQGNSYIAAQSLIYPNAGWNVFVIEDWTNLAGSCSPNGSAPVTPTLTVKQAYDIDMKIDDGLPATGNVFVSANTDGYYVNNGGGNAEAGTAATCFDNSASSSGTPGVALAKPHYSVEMNGGSGLNCIPAFRITAGD